MIAGFIQTNGSNESLSALSYTVGYEITSFTESGEPGSSPTYELFTQRAPLHLTGITYTKSTTCGHTLKNLFAHTIPSETALGIIFTSTYVTPSFEIYSSDGTHEAAYNA